MKVAVLGGGLARLSGAYHLGERATVFERESDAGGVARSVSVDGFTFDHTGHLLHFKDPRIQRLLEELVPGLFIKWDRRASVYRGGVKTEYPFQVNTHGHPPEIVAECVTGFVRALQAGEDRSAGSFKEWVLATFGEGFARHFFFPYNEKFWRRDLDHITADWVAWAIPRPTLEGVVEGALGVVRRGLGYNPYFLYPSHGGIGQLASALAERVAHLRLGMEAVAVDSRARQVRFADGTHVGYEQLVSTLPLPRLIAISDLPQACHDAAAALDWMGVLNFNVGIRRERAWEDHWTYFMEPEFPFYRVGAPTAFSHGVAPPGTTSLYVEVTYRRDAEPDAEALWPEVLAGLMRAGIVRDPGEIAVRHVIRIPCAYVVFNPERARVLPGLFAALEERGIHSIGRYGAWEYASMEKALLDGMTIAAALGRG